MTDALVILEQNLGTSKKTPKGEYLFHCPFCHHHKKKLSVNLAARFGSWKCWVCNKAGRKLVSLMYAIHAPQDQIQKIREIDPDYIEYHSPTEHIVVETPRLPAEYKPLYVTSNTFAYNHALGYVLKRGFSIWDIIKHRIGYAVEGQYANRIIIPSYDKTHFLNFFVSRAFYSGETFKYKNPPYTKDIIVFENMINWELPVILVEGVFDAITIKQNAIPLLGKFISRTLLAKLIETRPPMVYIILDADAQESAFDLYNTLTSYGLNVKNVVPSGKDANEMGFDNIWKDITSSHEMDFKELITQRLYAT